MNIGLSFLSVIIILSFCIDFLLLDREQLLVCSCKSALYFNKFVSKLFVFHLNFEKFLHGIISIHCARFTDHFLGQEIRMHPTIWWILKDRASCHIHLNMWIQSLKCAEHRLHIWFFYIIQRHGIVHLFKLSVKRQYQILFIEFIELALTCIEGRTGWL